MEQHSKPEPRGDSLNGEFYEHTAKGELRFQRCDDCSTWRHMPRHTCAKCGSSKWHWALSSGRGSLYSWTVTHRAFHPAFNDDVPYGTAVVELEEGVRIISQIPDLPVADYRLGLALEVIFVKRGEFTLPMFKPA
jgi:uncharacterized OB-fold protein